jgi:hypothetical protein
MHVAEDRPTMPDEPESLLEFFAAKAIRLGFDELEVEYDDGSDQICALKGGSGIGIGSIPWSVALRKELSAITRRKRVIVVGGVKVELRAREFDSFGETAYRVTLRPVLPKTKR